MTVVLVSGASGGIGRATVARFVAAGAVVYAGVRHEVAAGVVPASAADDHRDVRPIALDVTDAAAIDAARARVLDECGRIDVLVNNAGVHRLGAFEDLDEAEWRAMLEVNFYGAVRLTRAFLPAMRTRRGGCIVMVSSVGGFLSRAGDAAYCASKWALEAATEALRFEVERWGIRVALVQPGAVRTGISAEFQRLPGVPDDSPYRPLLEFRGRIATQACAEGGDPALVAEAIYAVATNPSPRLRNPVGTQAERLAAEVGTWTDAERSEWIRRAARTAWWSEGADSPE